MSVTSFFRTIFGTSKEEADLKRRAAEAVRKAKNGASSIEAEKVRLQEAQRKIHSRAEEIKRTEEAKRSKPDQKEGEEDGPGE